MTRLAFRAHGLMVSMRLQCQSFEGEEPTNLFKGHWAAAISSHMPLLLS
jgi:hypothetical protein